MGDEPAYWEGNAWFASNSQEIEVFVDGASDDDFVQQHEFFKNFCEQWPKMHEQVENALRAQSPKAQGGQVRFVVSAVSVPKCSIEDAEWDIFFSTLPASNDAFTVHMKGCFPVGVVRDS